MLLMHLDATFLTFSSTCSWCYALDFQMSLWTCSWCILMLRSWLSHQHALDATLLTFKCHFEHALDASWCYVLDFLINMLLMLRSWLSNVTFEHALDASWFYVLDFLINMLLMLRSWLSNVTFEHALDAFLMLWSSMFYVTSNTLLISLDASWFYALDFLMYLPTRFWCYALSFPMSLWTCSWCVLMLRSW